MNLFVYIVECSDGSFYTGVTNNVDRRVAEHNEGLNKKACTYRKRPVKLVYHEGFTDPQYAIAIEKQIKGWSRKKKIALIKGEWEKLPELAKRFNKKKSCQPTCFGTAHYVHLLSMTPRAFNFRIQVILRPRTFSNDFLLFFYFGRFLPEKSQIFSRHSYYQFQDAIADFYMDDLQ
jgi:putative endonuclease